MKRNFYLTKYTVLLVLFIFFIFSNSCNYQSEADEIEILLAPLEVGSKTVDYEVISPSEIKLSPGVKIQHIKDSHGANNGFILLRENGSLGGYMACECMGSTSGDCATENDNPENASCMGGCKDSEGNPRPSCVLAGPFEGPSRDNTFSRTISKRVYDKIKMRN